MARPRKDPELRKSAQLRIPVTQSEKKLVTEAARAANQDMAPWARIVLLREAHQQKARKTAKESGARAPGR